jgi:hypothetical protein
MVTAYRQHTKHYYSGVGGTVYYAPVRAYIRMELKNADNDNVLAWRWVEQWQEGSKKLDMVHGFTVHPGNRYKIQVRVACTGGDADERVLAGIILSATMTLR